MKTLQIRFRKLVTVNTDPQRRCYHGAHFSSKEVWSDWTSLESGVAADKVEARLTFWRELNAYAVAQRGKENTLAEYEAFEEAP